MLCKNLGLSVGPAFRRAWFCINCVSLKADATKAFYGGNDAGFAIER
jgi:hypothetical protein